MHMKKICSKCGEKKQIEEYRWKNLKKRRRHSFCRECHAKYRKEHYLKNKEKYLTKARVWNKGQTILLRKFILEYLSSHACVDCGIKDIRVLDFDHEGKKRMGISKMVRNCYSTETIIKEISVCKVRCANCHRIKTFERGSFWKDKFTKNN